MIYLPLLFADGQPTSLERITASQLEKFIPFMLSCCPETSGGVPVWWPPTIPYNIPLSRIPGPLDWLTCLKEIVCRCYEFHKCEHVLRFCARLAEIPASALKYKETTQGFISIHNKLNNKLIVTFKKKNQIYDRPVNSPFKSLLPKKLIGEHREVEDIYLCNYCDEEFTSGKDAIAHERVCTGKIDEVQEEAVDQVSVMRYFGLGPPKTLSKEAGTPITKRGTSVRLTGRSYMTIPIASPLGLKMGSNVSPLKEEDKKEYLERIEAHCCKNKCSDSSQTRRPRKFGLPYRRFQRKRMDCWTHTYCFNRAQKEERKLTIRTGLNKNARLLLKKCKNCTVLVERLPLLDPLALHAAASLQVHFPQDAKHNKPENLLGVSPDLAASGAICIDLTFSDSEDSDEVTNNNCDSERSYDSFFSASSNHKRPILNSWNSFPMPPSLLPIASV